MACECGCTLFNARQVCHNDIIVNEYNEWKSNIPEDNACCYDAGTPFGPYTCFECGKVYEEIPN